ncbi:MAG: SDR family NAD(P)-dependent oxidoreductase [Cellvibrionales bacterium]|nr:SDR family NAD(P)-dependent oxidoreductase [Cellvibrionales bacterium]
MESFENNEFEKTVLITGCSSGIGRSTAIHFARLDWHVIATVRHQDDADKLMMLGYTNIQAELLDVDDENQIQSLFNRIKQQSPNAGLDVLINNAAIAEPYPLEFANIEHFQRHLSTNVIAPMVLIRTFLPLLRQNSGSIVNVGASSFRMSTPLMGAYNASKAALQALSDVLRIELHGSSVRVIVIEPGVVDTPLHNHIHNKQTQLASQITTEGFHSYQGMIDRQSSVKSHLKKNALKPSRVARLIAKVVLLDNPKPVYQVGMDAKLISFVDPVLSTPIKGKLWKTVLGNS